MLTRVATFANTDQMVAAALRTQSTMANQQIQEASGLVSSDFGGLGSSSQQVLNLQVSVTRSQSYIDAATLANGKVEVMYSAVNSIADLITEFRTLLTSASNVASTDAASVTQSAQSMLEQMASLLNTQYNSGYLFAGSDTKTAPVDVSSSVYAAATSPSSADTSYYQGNDDLASVRVSDSQTVSYGVTADSAAFEQVMRAMNLVANNSPLSTETLNEALDLAVGAIDSIGVIQTKLSNAASSIAKASSYQSEYQSYAETLGSDLTGVDVAAVTAKLSTYEAQLTASYSAIAKVQGLNLASYLA
ncbi:putative flagellar hook-associated protein 3 FlgL [Rhodopseudomonas palustris HaA2]|uniref:Putative flagellar hook-associated protein 3 FlgL n=1 Tax=Rhodopseudomonas palustris (strain HaA2) TaxID=316058 RepID=Q2J230_RHOP2|nr:flagellin [Rhodopseudomonas palustris]ABD05480.1 putative flagellar hook-associated protein 3 FlgL [Rhodopseudomonas palustris HaA2]